MPVPTYSLTNLLILSLNCFCKVPYCSKILSKNLVPAKHYSCLTLAALSFFIGLGLGITKVGYSKRGGGGAAVPPTGTLDKVRI